MKDKVEMLDRTGAVYYNVCKKTNCNERPKNDYVGETDRVKRTPVRTWNSRPQDS